MSNINPQNIDGTYPIAGQDNNSQGFRDNFTNTVNNFTFAAAELTDLQQNAMLRAPLGSVGQTGTPTNDMNYAYITHAQIKGSVETAALNLTVDGSNNFSVNWESGHFQSVTITANSTFTFGTWPTANYFTKLRLQVTVSGGTYTLTFPSSVNINVSSLQGYTSGTTVSLAAGVYVFEFSTVNFGANVAIQDVLRNYNVESGGTTGTFSTVNATTLNIGTPLANVRTTGNVIGGLAQFAAINNTPIGNATPSTGTFSTVTAGDVSSGFIGNTGTAFTGASVNVSGNVLAASATLGALTVNGVVSNQGVNATGNIIATGGIFNALTINGDATFSGNVIRAGGMIDSGYQYYAPSGNVEITANVNVSRVILDPTGDAFGVKFTLPSGNVDAKVVTLSSTANIAGLQPIGNLGTTVVPSVNIAIPKGTQIQFFYHAVESKWYKVA